MKKQSTKRVPCFKRWSRKSYGAFASLGREVRIGTLCISMSMIANQTFAVQADSTRTERIEAIQVTALRGSASARALTRPSVVVDPSTLQFSALSSIENALRLAPQFDIRQRGARGTQADISIRGGSPDQAMILLNGVNFSDARTGHQSHSLPLGLPMIEAIDFLPITQSVGALGGAIDYRTKQLDKNSLAAEIYGGQFGTYGVNLTGGVRNAKSSIALGASYDHSDGYITNTDYSRLNIYLRAQHADPVWGNFDFQAGYQMSDFGANGFYSLAYPNQWEATRTALASMVWNKRFSPRFTLNALASYRLNTDRFELFRPGTTTPPEWYKGGNYHLTDNVGASIWGEMAWGAVGTTSLGLDYTYNHIWSTVLGLPTDPRNIGGNTYNKAKDRNSFSLYATHKVRLGDFDAILSASLNNDDYGFTPLWGVSAGYTPVDGLRVGLSAASTMRLPTFTDLYYTTATHVGNSGLVPELAITYGFDVNFTRLAWSTTATVYYRQGSNIIDWVRPVGQDIWHSEQITKLNTLGFELMTSYRPQRGVLQSVVFNYSHIASQKQSSGKISKYALDYMRNKASLTASIRILPSLVLSATGSLYDRTGVYEVAAGQVENFRPYFILDSRLTWSLTKVRLWAECTNILDREYFDFAGLQLPGRWFMAGVGVKIF